MLSIPLRSHLQHSATVDSEVVSHSMYSRDVAFLRTLAVSALILQSAQTEHERNTENESHKPPELAVV